MEGVSYADGVWFNTDTSVDGTITTPDCEVTNIVMVDSVHTDNSGDVTYLVSFDSGVTWYSYSGGFVVYTSGYGMTEGVMKAITQEEWGAMISNNTVMVKAILRGNATLTDIQIFTEVYQ